MESWCRSKKLESWGVKTTELWVLIFIAASDSSSSTHSLTSFLWKSLLLCLLTSAIFAWFIGGVSYSFCQPSIFYFEELPPPQPETWEAWHSPPCPTGCSQAQHFQSRQLIPQWLVQGWWAHDINRTNESAFEEKKGVSPVEVVSLRTMWIWVSLPGSQFRGSTSQRQSLSATGRAPRSSLWASSDVSQYIPFSSSWGFLLLIVRRELH